MAVKRICMKSFKHKSAAHPTPDPLLFALQTLVVDMALIDRNHHLTAQARNENDIEHSFAVALLCWFIHDKYNLPLSLEKILQYALVHDFAERYAGDTNTYADPAARARKIELERQALERLSGEFKDFRGLVTAMTAYDTSRDAEALFVWTVDKMQAMILGDLDGWRPYQKINITYDRFVAKHSEQLASCSPYCKEIFATLLEYCKTTYYDRPQPSPVA